MELLWLSTGGYEYPTDDIDSWLNPANCAENVCTCHEDIELKFIYLKQVVSNPIVTPCTDEYPTPPLEEQQQQNDALMARVSGGTTGGCKDTMAREEMMMARISSLNAKGPQSSKGKKKEDEGSRISSNAPNRRDSQKKAEEGSRMNSNSQSGKDSRKKAEEGSRIKSDSHSKHDSQKKTEVESRKNLNLQSRQDSLKKAEEREEKSEPPEDVKTASPLSGSKELDKEGQPSLAAELQ
ncbi:hypothetical protein COOONC_02593 [Cooperia oncophora]